jgi:uncharacterized protein (TIRG00374 family)
MERFRARNIWYVVIIGAVVFGVFTHEIGFGKLLVLMGSVNKPLLLIAVFLNLLNLISYTITWLVLVSADISLYKLFKFYMAGTFINNITPAFGTGGEPVKAMLLGKETGISKAECFAGVVSQRMLNMFPFFTIGMIGIWLLFTKPRNFQLANWQIAAMLFSIGLAVFGFVLIIYFYLRKDKLSSFVQSAIRFFAPFIGLVKKGFDHKEYIEAVEESIDSFHGGLRNIRNNKYGLWKAILFSYFGWILDIMAIYIIFLSIGETDIHISILIITYTIAMISGWLPLFLPGGLGIVDGTMAILFIYAGVPLEMAVLATLLYRLASYWFNTVLGAFYLWGELKTG